jgi:hypothetical protein
MLSPFPKPSNISRLNLRWLPEGEVVTVCVASVCSNRDAIVCVADKAVTINQYIQWDADATKILRIGPPKRIPPCVALISGEEDFSLDLIAEVEKQPNFGVSLRPSMIIAETAYKKLLQKRIETSVLTPKLLSKSDYLSLLPTQAVNSTYVDDIKREINLHQVSCSVLFCGFENKQAFIFHVGYPGRARDCTHSGFEAIGSGSEMAMTRLLSLEARQADGMIVALYNAFDGKASAEIIRGVGYEWDASVLVAMRKQIKVPRPAKRLIENLYSEASTSPFHPQFGSGFTKVPKWQKQLIAWGKIAMK